MGRFTYDQYCNDLELLWKLISSIINHPEVKDTVQVMTIPLSSLESYVEYIYEENKRMHEDYDYLTAGTILELGSHIKYESDFDKDRWINSLEKEIFHLVKCCKDDAKRNQEQYAAECKLKHNIWTSRARYNRLAANDSGYMAYLSTHPWSVITYEKWHNAMSHAADLCDEYAKKFEDRKLEK